MGDHGVQDGDQRDSDQRADDAGQEGAGCDGEEDAERVKRDKATEDEGLKHVLLDL